mmetsp:Transcript_56640/g.94009  ORF Transcript_56640/g.94009 Transcript_56640/m.94009 type:complete len:202 (+) Transcript_56640:1816-2421(+)
MELGGRQVAVAVVVHDAEDARQRAEPTGPGAIEDALPDRVHDRDARLLQLGLRLLHALHLQVRFGGRHDVPLILVAEARQVLLQLTEVLGADGDLVLVAELGLVDAHVLLALVLQPLCHAGLGGLFKVQAVGVLAGLPFVHDGRAVVPGVAPIVHLAVGLARQDAGARHEVWGILGRLQGQGIGLQHLIHRSVVLIAARGH